MYNWCKIEYLVLYVEYVCDIVISTVEVIKGNDMKIVFIFFLKYYLDLF